MEERHERLNKQFSELEEEWAAMKTGKGSSAVTCSSTIEEAMEFVENSPRKLMLSLQHDQACPEAERMRSSPCRRKLFHDSDDSDDESKITPLSRSTCWSSNVMGVRDINNKKKKESQRGVIVCVGIVVVLLLFLALVMDGFDHHSGNMQINTLVPT